MGEGQFGIITFKSTHHAIRGDLVFKDQPIKYRTIPLPREISHSCGLAIRFDLDNLELVNDIIQRSQLEIDGIYKYIRNEKGNKAEQIV